MKFTRWPQNTPMEQLDAFIALIVLVFTSVWCIRKILTTNAQIKQLEAKKKAAQATLRRYKEEEVREHLRSKRSLAFTVISAVIAAHVVPTAHAAPASAYVVSLTANASADERAAAGDGALLLQASTHHCAGLRDGAAMDEFV